MKTLIEEWDHFAELVVPEDAGDVQRRDMKKAFFAGALISAKHAGKRMVPLLEDWQSLHAEADEVIQQFIEEDKVRGAGP